MKRRSALQQLLFATGGLVALPAWAKNWTPVSVTAVPALLTADQQTTLAEVVETFIPATDVPGAKTLEVHRFIQKMVADCYEKSVQGQFQTGLATLEKKAQEGHGRSFAVCDAPTRESLLQAMATATDADQKAFFSLVKSLTIQGYTSSEYVMTKYLHYNMAPGHYYGCVPAVSKSVSQK